VNLRATDLPGFKASKEHEHETAAEKSLERKMLRCTGGVGFNNGLAEASSKEFEREHGVTHQGISSNITVVQTAALAAKELAAMRSSHVERCLSHYVNLIFEQLAQAPENHGMTAGLVSILPLSLPAPGTTGSFGWRMTATFNLHGIKLPFSMDLMGFVFRSAEIALFASGLPEPVPAATEERLFSLLDQRARAHAL
jgi:hypothetical protein